MNDNATEETERREERHEHNGPCGPWGHMCHKMWMFGPGASSRGSRGGFPPGSRRGRGSRAQRWMYDNPTDEQIIEFLEGDQRDLEQQIEDVRTRIEDIKGRTDK